VLHNFYAFDYGGCAPQAPLIFDAKGNLYGTAGCGAAIGGGPGVAYRLAPSKDGTWTESVLYHFGRNSIDGVGPEYGALILDSKGDLFGTTLYGGANDAGTVFELTPEENGDWNERVIFDFSGGELLDGYSPAGGLVADSAGNLYGTTQIGGMYGWGAAFEIHDPYRTGAPQLSLPAGTYDSTQKVTITDYTPGARIYFTTNGDEPSAESSDEYSGPIEVKHTETIKAIAVAKGLTDSGLAAAKYVIHLPAATPEITPPPATYHALQKVTITDATADAAIYYTTNGRTPTPVSGEFYRGPFRIDATTTVKAIATAPGRSESKVATDAITIHLPPASETYDNQP